MEKIKIVTHFTHSKLPYLNDRGIVYRIIEDKKETVMIEMEVDGFTLIELFAAGVSQGINDLTERHRNNILNY